MTCAFWRRYYTWFALFCCKSTLMHLCHMFGFFWLWWFELPLLMTIEEFARSGIKYLLLSRLVWFYDAWTEHTSSQWVLEWWFWLFTVVFPGGLTSKDCQAPSSACALRFNWDPNVSQDHHLRPLVWIGDKYLFWCIIPYLQEFHRSLHVVPAMSAISGDKKSCLHESTPYAVLNAWLRMFKDGLAFLSMDDWGGSALRMVKAPGGGHHVAPWTVWQGGDWEAPCRGSGAPQARAQQSNV